MGHVTHTVMKFVTRIDPSIVIAASILAYGFYAGMYMLATRPPAPAAEHTLVVQVSGNNEPRVYKINKDQIERVLKGK